VFRTAAVERGNLIVTISATGTVEPEEVIDVGAQVAGQILSSARTATASRWTTVRRSSGHGAGGTSTTPCTRPRWHKPTRRCCRPRAACKRAEADLEQMRSRLEQAENNWKRAQQVETRAMAALDYDNYKAEFNTAKANLLVGQAAIVQAKGALAQAEGMLQRAKRNLSYTHDHLAGQGRHHRPPREHRPDGSGEPQRASLFLIAKDLTRIQVWVAVNEADIGRLHPGQPVSFTVDAFPGESFKGQGGQGPPERLDDAERRHVHGGGRGRQFERAAAAVPDREREVRA